MNDYKFGTFVFIPHGEPRTRTDQLRQQYDPLSARTSSAHITITQPLALEPSLQEITLIEKTLAQIPSFNVHLGPAIPSPNKRLLWFDVQPSEPVLHIRECLYRLGIFRTDLPLTKGFIPHMTISEKGRDPDRVASIIRTLNKQRLRGKRKLIQ